MLNNNVIVSIEGNIGSGKSTLFDKLTAHFKDNAKIVFLKEPVEDWASIKDINGTTMLELFYSDPTKHAFAFQMMAYISRLAALKETLKNNNDCVIITERSVHTDKMVFAKMLFDSNHISLENFTIYLKWFDTFIDGFDIDKIIYIKTDPVICCERIKKRSRTGENNIELAYLDQCHLYHENMVTSNVCQQQMVLDGNIDIYENKEQLLNWISQIEMFILGVTL